MMDNQYPDEGEWGDPDYREGPGMVGAFLLVVSIFAAVCAGFYWLVF